MTKSRNENYRLDRPKGIVDQVVHVVYSWPCDLYTR